MFQMFNANPLHNRVGDCVVRSLAFALNQSWEQTYIELCVQGYTMCDMPTANHVWGEYLIRKGYKRKLVPDDVRTVCDFCDMFRKGSYILAISGHVVAVQDGCYYDSWDSGNEVPIYYWEKSEV